MLAGALSSPSSLLRVGGRAQERLGQGRLVVGGDEPAGSGGNDLGRAVRVGGEHRQSAGHRLDQDEPERLRDRGQDEQVGGVQRLRQLARGAASRRGTPAGSPTARAAVSGCSPSHSPGLPPTSTSGSGLPSRASACAWAPDQQRQPLDGGEAADVEQDGRRLRKGQQLVVR